MAETKWRDGKRRSRGSVNAVLIDSCSPWPRRALDGQASDTLKTCPLPSTLLVFIRAADEVLNRASVSRVAPLREYSKKDNSSRSFASWTYTRTQTTTIIYGTVRWSERSLSRRSSPRCISSVNVGGKLSQASDAFSNSPARSLTLSKTLLDSLSSTAINGKSAERYSLPLRTRHQRRSKGDLSETSPDMRLQGR